MTPRRARSRARSSATQHIIFDWVKCLGSLRTSQIPASGSPPDPADVVRHLGQPAADVGVDPMTGVRVEPRGLQQLAVGVELKLLGRGVADPHGARASVAVQRQRPLGRTRAAVEPVEDPKARVRELGGVHQPPEVRARLRRAAEPQERVEREGRIANPREPIVPVALTADLLRQRRRRRRRHRS